jgi:hypothetical protein
VGGRVTYSLDNEAFAREAPQRGIQVVASGRSCTLRAGGDIPTTVTGSIQPGSPPSSPSWATARSRFQRSSGRACKRSRSEASPSRRRRDRPATPARGRPRLRLRPAGAADKSNWPSARSSQLESASKIRRVSPAYLERRLPRAPAAVCAPLRRSVDAVDDVHAPCGCPLAQRPGGGVSLAVLPVKRRLAVGELYDYCSSSRRLTLVDPAMGWMPGDRFSGVVDDAGG